MNDPPINDLDRLFLAMKEHTSTNKEICDLLRRMTSHLEIIHADNREIMKLLTNWSSG